MNGSLVRGGTRRIARGAGLVAAAALGVNLLALPPAAHAEPHNDPGTCTERGVTFTYHDKYASTLTWHVTIHNYGDFTSHCRVIIRFGPDGPCRAVAPGRTDVVNLLRSSLSPVQKVVKC